MKTDTAALVAAIYNAAWSVRHYRRPMQEQKRAQAVQRLGLTAREAFNTTTEFEAVLYAVCDSLAETPDLRFAVRR